MRTIKPLVVALAALAASQINGYSQANNKPILTKRVFSMPAWHGVASTGCVDEFARNLYANSGASFAFSANSTSPVATLPGPGTRPSSKINLPIVTRLNVAPTFDEVKDWLNPATATAGDLFGATDNTWEKWNTLSVGYRDPDGKQTATRVRVLLKRVNRTNLSESTVATFDSNAFSTTAAGQNAISIVHDFDSLNFNYFVEIELYRTNAQVASPSCSFVRLEYSDDEVVPN